MQAMNERPDQRALTIDKSASALGLHQFSLLSRIQAGEIKSARLRLGEMAIPAEELERLARSSMNTLAVPSQARDVRLSDERLGIGWTPGLTRRNGEHLKYTAPGHVGRFTESEVKSYRAAFGAIAEEFESLTGLKKQLDRTGSAPSEKEINTPQIGRWLVRSLLLDLGQSKILLCQRADYDFAIIERFRDDSLYAKANGGAEILMQGERNRQLTEDFKADAQHTLKFMASNLTAKAQRIVWEQFPDHRPGRVVEAISERCRQAVAHEETIKVTHSVSHGVRM